MTVKKRIKILDQKSDIELFRKYRDKVLKTIDDHEIIITNLKIDHQQDKIFFVVKYITDNSYGYLYKNQIVFN